jgi:hypothetical protein
MRHVRDSPGDIEADLVLADPAWRKLFTLNRNNFMVVAMRLVYGGINSGGWDRVSGPMSAPLVVLFDSHYNLSSRHTLPSSCIFRARAAVPGPTPTRTLRATNCEFDRIWLDLLIGQAVSRGLNRH